MPKNGKIAFERGGDKLVLVMLSESNLYKEDKV